MIERDDAGRFVFVPGQSGNPNGRPRGVVRPLLREIVSEAHSGGGSKLEAMLRRVVDLALTEQRTSEALKAAAWVTGFEGGGLGHGAARRARPDDRHRGRRRRQAASDLVRRGPRARQ
ncbi:MAG: DUF5681 domain-containing protein [Planctomycetota bacterium]|jgi:hypothetical protein